MVYRLIVSILVVWAIVPRSPIAAQGYRMLFEAAYQEWRVAVLAQDSTRLKTYLHPKLEPHTQRRLLEQCLQPETQTLAARYFLPPLAQAASSRKASIHWLSDQYDAQTWCFKYCKQPDGRRAWMLYKTKALGAS